MMLPKPSTPRDKKYLAFIRKQPCCRCGSKFQIEAHHTSTGGIGLKGSDYDAVSLCFFCHKNMDNHRKDSIPGLQSIITRLRTLYSVQKQ